MARDARSGVAIERHERAQVEDARLDAVRRQPFGDAQRHMHVGAVRHDREIVARAAERGLAERDRFGRFIAQRLTDARIAIEGDVLVVEHRVRIGHRAAISARASNGVEGTTILMPGVR